jgi:hypothetical protein
MLRFWDLTSARLALTMPAHSAWVWDLAISPTGDLLATASADRTIKLWSIEVLSAADHRASLLRTLTGHTETVWGVDFASDGRTLASASWDQTVRLWDAGGGEQLAVLEGHTDWVYDVVESRPAMCWPARRRTHGTGELRAAGCAGGVRRPHLERGLLSGRAFPGQRVGWRRSDNVGCGAVVK